MPENMKTMFIGKEISSILRGENIQEALRTNSSEA
jgi:hypothetical protein